MKEKVGTFISPQKIFIITGLSDCAANGSNRPARRLAHLVGMKPNFQGCYCG